MINLHLLTRISGNDSTFRNNFFELIVRQSNGVISQLETYHKTGNWSSAYLLLDRYSKSIQPYVQPSFYGELSSAIAEIPRFHQNDARLTAIHLCIEKLANMTAPREMYGAVALSA